MSEINYIDLDRCNENDRKNYRKKSLSNLNIFGKIFGNYVREIHSSLSSFLFDEENNKLMKRCGEISGTGFDFVKIVNLSDEHLNYSSSFQEHFGCTSIGKDGVIGQTPDLYTVDLSLIKEGGALYATMPPYLTLMGMNEHIAFCTNYLFSEVRTGVPVSNLRRNLLRQKSIDGIVNYLNNVKRTTAVNFLITDGKNMLDIESTPAELKIHESNKSKKGSKDFIAHTNHILKEPMICDTSCDRLSRAVTLLERDYELRDVLNDETITVPIGFNGGIGFGSIIKVIMDVKNKSFYYKEPSSLDYSCINL